MASRTLPALVALLVLFGCKSGPSSRPESGGAPPSFDAFCASLVEVLGARQAGCASGPVGAWTTRLAADSGCDEISAGIAAGRIRYRPEAANDCLGRLRSEPCGPALNRPLALCSEALAGLMEPTQPCFSQYDCAPEAFCSSAGAACPGTCNALQPVGSSCDGATPCVTGASCVKGACLAAASDGEPCGPGTAGCGSGLKCVNGDAGPVCRPDATRVACSTASDCGFDELCSATDGGSFCAPKRLPGAPCAPGKRECGRLSYCGDDGTCVAWSAAGGPCGVFPGEVAGCLDGYCEAKPGARGTCRAFKPAGAPCEPGPISGCRGACDPATGTCEQKCALRVGAAPN